VKPLIGNHEEYLLMAHSHELHQKRKYFFLKPQHKLFDEWIKHGGNFTLKSFNVKKVTEIPEKYIRWIENLQHFYEEEKYIIVHAGLNFDRLDPFEDKHAMLWTKSFKPNTQKIDNKVIVHGHVPVSFSFLKTTLANPNHKYIVLDNGCYLPHSDGMGNLLALELNTLELKVQKCLD